jgi:putative colanic acid biosysnthesis UDP-glucose lipid carrier transferase
MLQEQSRLFQRILFFADLALVAAAWAAAYVLRFHTMPWLHAHGVGPSWFVPPVMMPPASYAWQLPWVLAGTALVFYASGLYAPERVLNRFRLTFAALRSAAMSLLGVAALLTFYRAFVISRIFLALLAVLVPLGMVGLRLGLYGVFRAARHRARMHRRVLVVGAGRVGRRIAETLRAYPWASLDVVGFADDHPPQGVSVLGRVDEVPTLVDRLEAEGRPLYAVYLALPLRASDQLEALTNELALRTPHVLYVPDLFGAEVLNARVSELDGLPVLHLIDEVPLRPAWVVKRILDVVLAGLFVLVISPVLAALAVGVKLSSPGPVFYRQERVSLNGRRFHMLKFRSMPVEAEANTGAVWAKPGEQRATPFGAFLRRTSLDELPQFFNVLRGEMSIVGPRPERPVFVDQFRHEVPRYMLKHKVPAGITGWAQVHGWRGATSLEKRIEYDLYYIQHWSLRLDLKIMLMTVFRGFVHEHAY